MCDVNRCMGESELCCEYGYIQHCNTSTSSVVRVASNEIRIAGHDANGMMQFSKHVSVTFEQDMCSDKPKNHSLK